MVSNAPTTVSECSPQVMADMEAGMLREMAVYIESSQSDHKAQLMTISGTTFDEV